jgi:hypothetical protein
VADEYESDNGFVEDGATSSSKPSKKAKNAFTFDASAGPQKDDDGNEFWEVFISLHRFQCTESIH